MSKRASRLFTEDDVVLAWNPFTHISGFVVGVVSICQGARIIVTEPSISSKDFLETLAKYHVSVLLGIPERLREVINEARSNNYPAVGLKKIIVAGTSISKSFGTEIYEFFGVKSFVNLYGMTETTGIVSCTPVGQISMGNVGFPSAGSKVKILDFNSGGSLGPHQNGEIVVQSRNLMKSYYNHPEDTRDVLSNDGWFRTGDL
ncbi:acyl-CoA synthetase, putative, partial [Ixodes scapularis]